MFLKDCYGYGLRTECSEKRVGVGRPFKKLVPQSRQEMMTRVALVEAVRNVLIVDMF